MQTLSNFFGAKVVNGNEEKIPLVYWCGLKILNIKNFSLSSDHLFWSLETKMLAQDKKTIVFFDIQIEWLPSFWF